MKVSRLMILGVALFSAIGAGYIAKMMAAAPSPPQVSEKGPAAPAIKMTQVLVVGEKVPVGGRVADVMKWQNWPADAVGEGLVT